MFKSRGGKTLTFKVGAEGHLNSLEVKEKREWAETRPESDTCGDAATVLPGVPGGAERRGGGPRRRTSLPSTTRGRLKEASGLREDSLDRRSWACFKSRDPSFLIWTLVTRA